jgi:hypothetical protein
MAKGCSCGQENQVKRVSLKGNENMSDITVSIPSDPFRTLIKSIIAEEQQPTLFISGSHRDAVADLIKGDARIRDEINDIVENVVNTTPAIAKRISEEIENSYAVERTIKYIVQNSVDYGEIAGNIELSDLATHFSPSDVASEINLGDIANEICLDSLADEVVERGIDYEKLAKALLREIRAEASKTNA